MASSTIHPATSAHSDTVAPNPVSRLATTGRCRGDGGLVYATVLVLPVVIIIFMTFVQWALYYHAEALVNAAVQDGARVAQAQSGTTNDGKAIIDATLADATHSGLLRDLTTTVTANPTQITATATATVPALVPLPLNRQIHATASGPKERLT
jgi:Flp pilus assembly protein TadG